MEGGSVDGYGSVITGAGEAGEAGCMAVRSLAWGGVVPPLPARLACALAASSACRSKSVFLLAGVGDLLRLLIK
jgi:hypothetical protein